MTYINDEAIIFAEESLRVDIQHRLQTVMNHLGISQSDLAARLGRYEAWVSQLFSSEMNMTVRQLAQVFHALGEDCVVTSKPRRVWKMKRTGGR